MSSFGDLTGQRFGRLTVKNRAKSANVHNSSWECLCDCGESTIVSRPGLIQGKTRSCGCLRDELIAQVSKIFNQTHGESSMGGSHKATKEYMAWHGMKDRCLRENHPDYHNYGGRGITVCEEWMNSYETFLADMGRCPRGMSLDRKDNNAGYSKENCRWATLEEQNSNQRKNIFLAHDGITLTIAQWARKIGMKKITLWQRVNRFGYSTEEALTAPVTPNGKRVRE